MFRRDVQKIVENADSSEEAGHLICYLMQNKIAAILNALFNDDPEMQSLLANASPELSERVEGLLNH
jgi:hypothetical protein